MGITEVTMMLLMGMFTGRIVKYIKADNKIDCLKDFCIKNHIGLNECIAVEMVPQTFQYSKNVTVLSR